MIIVERRIGADIFSPSSRMMHRTEFGQLNNILRVIPTQFRTTHTNFSRTKRPINICPFFAIGMQFGIRRGAFEMPSMKDAGKKKPDHALQRNRGPCGF